MPALNLQRLRDQLDARFRALPPRYRRVGGRLPSLALGAAIVWTSWSMAGLVWAVMPLPAAARWQPPLAAAPAPGSLPPAPPNPGEAIAQAHIFGQAKVPDAVLTPGQTPPVTTLNLVLTGIFYGVGEGFSRALIQLSPTEETPFALNAEVSPGVKLQAIFPDRVVLNRNGTLETLPLYKPEGSDAPGASGAPGASPVAVGGAPAGPAPGTPQAAQMMSTVRTQTLNDPSKLAQYMRFQPANEGGTNKGFRVYPGQDGAAFAAAGLQPGDIVTAVNGTSITQTDQAMQLLPQLQSASTVNLTIDRNGQVQTLTVNVSS